MRHNDKDKSINKIVISMVSAGLLGMLFLTGCNGDAEKPNYDKGVDALKNQSYQEALTFFNAAENEGVSNQLVYRGEGMANLGLAKYDDSIACFENALHESNGIVKKIDYDINFYLATALYKKGDLQGAYDTYSSIMQLDEKNATACYLRGKVCLDMDRIEDAKSDFVQSIDIDRSNPSLYINIHNDLLSHGYESEAKSYINLAIKNVNKPSKYDLGVFNYFLGDYTQARNYFEETKNIKSNPEGIIYLAKTYMALGDDSYAISLYENFINNNPNSSEVYNELGNLKFNLKDYEGALAAYETGLKAEDVTYKQELMFNRIVAYEYLHNYNTAKTLMGEYLGMYPDDEVAIRENVFLSTR